VAEKGVPFGPVFTRMTQVQEAARSHRAILAVLFGAGLLILLDQGADLLATLLVRPVELGSASWRFGVFGLLASRVSALIVADVMLFVAAVALGWRGVLRWLGVIHLGLSAVFAGGLVLFFLDALQVRGTMPAQSAAAISGAAARAGIVALATCVALAWAGIAARRGGGNRTGRRERAPLVVSETKDGLEG
jgi:hypothetical protein